MASGISISGKEVADGGFCCEAWERSTALRETIYGMPFVLELGAGTLPQEVFQGYVLQDSAYLVEFSRCLSIAASKATESKDAAFLAEASAAGIKVEMSLHGGFLQEFGVSEEARRLLEPSPTCAGYCNFLLATAHTKPFEVLCAALLPCFWLYRDVGQRIVTAAAQSNPYQKWIDMYAGEEFGRSVRAMQELCDRLAERATSKQREEMIGAFMLAARFEWMFFNAAYCLEGWPISLVGTLDGPSE